MYQIKPKVMRNLSHTGLGSGHMVVGFDVAASEYERDHDEPSPWVWAALADDARTTGDVDLVEKLILFAYEAGDLMHGRAALGADVYEEVENLHVQQISDP